MIRYVVLCTKTYFISIKQSSLHSSNSQDSPNSTNLPNLHNTRQTRLCEYCIFVKLAKLALSEYLFFLTYLPNLTHASIYFRHTLQIRRVRVTSSTRNVPQTRLRVLARVLATFCKTHTHKVHARVATA